MTSLWEHPAIIRSPGPRDDVLRRLAVPVTSKHGRTVAKRLLALVASDPAASGLAAPQIGESVRVIAVRASFGLHAIINPVILDEGGDLIVQDERCFSLPGVRVPVERRSTLAVVGLNARGRPLQALYLGGNARIVLHEIDHLDGILITDADPDA